MNTESGLTASTVIGIPPAGMQRRAKAAPEGDHAASSQAVKDLLRDSKRSARESGFGHFDRAAEVMPREVFLKQLSREKRRVDRSKSPLSLVVFCPGVVGESGGARLLDVLLGSTRDTDIVGWLDDGEIAVLLPDTDKDGGARFADKVMSRAGDISFTTTAATYPDHIFDDLASGETDLMATQPLMLDHELVEGRQGTYPLKRALDIVGSLFALLLLSPVMLAVAIAVARSSPGPIIFRQKRVGRHGVPFTFYKFRSMRCDTDDRIHREFVENLIKGEHAKNQSQSGSQSHYKIKADPRVTKVGAFIRRTSIDEIPQFFNVLKGDMSLVGPRPPLPYEAKAYQSWHLRRVLESKPGITGLWQVEGRSKVTFDEMVRMDLRYVRECSLALDLRTLFRTVKVVLGDDGAN